MEKENKIVNWNGDLADLPFNDLTVDEMDIFLAVCYECQRQKNNLVKIKLSELERLGSFNAYGKQRFGTYIESVFKSCLGSILFIKTINTMIVLFSLPDLALTTKMTLLKSPLTNHLCIY